MSRLGFLPNGNLKALRRDLQNLLMGVFKTSFKVCNPKDENKCVLVKDAIVDTGSTLTWVPSGVLEQIGLKPEKTRTFVSITGEKIERGVSPALCQADGEKPAGCDVVFGKQGDRTVLGATVLETLGLDVDMDTQKLKRKTSFLAV